MKNLYSDAVVIGAGAAGLAAALELDDAGASVVLIDRDDHLGGILMQCIHNGFGLQEFNEELTGPEFAERFMARLPGAKIVTFLNTTVISIDDDDRRAGGGVRSQYSLYCVNRSGVACLHTRAVILAMGCREKNRGNVRIPGARPAGVFTAGLAQRLVNIDGYIPGKEIVIIGSGDIGLIMARRMTWIGCHVRGVVEIMPYPAGLTRNIVQCLQDFDIPLYLSAQTTNIFGADRVEGVEVTPMEGGVMQVEKRFRLDCDTVLLSVGLVPENELSRAAGVELHPVTGGPLVDAHLMTRREGIFACGNVLHVHDLVDNVVEEARRAGRYAAAWLRGEHPALQIRTRAGANIRYVNPGKLDLAGDNRVFMRSLIVKNNAALEITAIHGSGRRLLRSVRKGHVQPSEMISIDLGVKELEGLTEEDSLEFRIV